MLIDDKVSIIILDASKSSDGDFIFNHSWCNHHDQEF